MRSVESAHDAELPRPLEKAPWWAEVVARAATLAERRAACLLPAPESEAALIAERCERWRRFVSGPGEDNLSARLASLGLDEPAARRCLASAAWPVAAEKPEWIDWLEQFLAEGAAAAQRNESCDRKDCLSESGEAAVPFGAFYGPILAVARRELRRRLAELPGWGAWAARHISVAVEPGLVATLRAELSELAWRALYEDFSKVRPLGIVLHRQMGSAQQEPPGAEHYREFMGSLWREEGPAWLLAYPSLARLLAVRARFWVESHVELLCRVREDWAAIISRFAPAGSAAVTLTAIEESVADYHQCGRAVAILRFGGVFACVYKPKDLRLGAQFQQLLDWCNREGAGYPGYLPLRTIGILSRDGYGWCEFVNAGGCADAAAADRYFRRAGQLLHLAHAMNGVDFHGANVIAEGEHPVLVDTESLLHPLFSAETQHEPGSVQAFGNRFAQSVMHTSLLPVWKLDPETNAAFDNSGLGSVGRSHYRGKVATWRDLHTDAMRLEYVAAGALVRKNLPAIAGRALHAGEGREACLAGYRTLHGLLAERRDRLQASPEWQGLAALPVRFLFRNTLTYGALWYKALEPQFLRCGVERSLQFERLARGVFGLREGRGFQALIEEEILELERGDVPFFHTRAASSEILAGGGVLVTHTGYSSAWAEIRQRLAQPPQERCEAQCDIALGALQARSVGAGRPARPAARCEVREGESLQPAAALQVACAIGDELVARAWRVPDAATWLGFSYFASGRWQFGPMSVSLYDGVSGPALLLASLAKVTGRADYRQTAVQALGTVRAWLAMEERVRLRWLERIGVGGLSGMGSVVYTLAQVGGLLEDPALVASAHEAARLLSPERLQGAPQREVMAGSAGGVLGLLALYRIARSEDLRQQIESGVRHLLAGEAGDPALRTAGFAHGRAGVYHAVAEAGRVLEQAAWREHGVGGLQRLLRWMVGEGEGDLPDEARLLAGRRNWCQGGIGLALPMLLLSGDDIGGALPGLLERARLPELLPLDQVCCGNLGAVEVLAAASRRLGQPVFGAAAGSLASAVLARRSQMRGFRIFEEISEPVWAPGFFQGLSGIGHTFLRLHTAALPEPLLLR